MSTFDPSPGLHPGATGPATRHVAITPDDGHDLPLMARHIYVGTAGDLAVVLRDSPLGEGPVVYKNVAVGKFDAWVRRVYATGTTATNLVAQA